MNRRQAAGFGAAAGAIGGALSYPVLRALEFPEPAVFAAINALTCSLADAILASMAVARIDVRFKPGPRSARILSSVCFGGPAGFLGGGVVGFYIGWIAAFFLAPGDDMLWMIPFLFAIIGAPTAGAVGLVVGGICGATAKPRTAR
ncbi:MAG TPA: hypothetical protein VFJ58_08350 [Armatimonadota bacterium]|nr:hypothetical protein [Armatimonadota bacterium]